MKGERGEVDYSITKPSKCETREQMRQRLAAEMAAFEANPKNKVEEVPRGASGFIPSPVRAKTRQQQDSKMRELAKNSKAGYTSRVWNDGGSVVK